MTCSPPALPLPLHGLDQVAPAHLPVLATLHRRRMPWQGQWRGQPLWLRAEPGEPVPLAPLHLTVGEHPLIAELPSAWLGELPQARDAAGELLLEAALLPLIEPLEATLGQPCYVTAARPFDTWLCLRWQLALGDGPGVTFMLYLSEGAARLLAAGIEAHWPAQRRPLPGLALPAQVSAAHVPLTLAELRSLRAGDVVMLDHTQPALHCAGRTARLKRVDTRWLLAGALTSGMETPMSDTPALAGPDAALDELDLTLTCQVGRLDLTLGQLRELGEGSVLALDSRADDGVELVVNGRRIGHGQLVRIGEGLGVRVLSFASL
ncbi:MULTISPECIES: type III secretion system cytoplasmic ring protein SctQ [unclassified Pseudomonas]|uniref:type III secretion system cytoplasmic ring protein SctQ n=1 Tax=unclassified Pseudomonas TaxID=196821 RepID=UPI000BD082CB|nr:MULTISPECIES: type III secretion system cytoplasmic ring protein SctQ [unclassified Pseudomonas]PVZ12538.1 type III secretion protein Q [Pseudomonas sp. URIL14HWK12:I12]PVZ23310.1 type III secretion protein Q [Pseudomonas sp. URIL14HWK12:I10]PVZ32640.1 type III secretion protein Q [Pseudomonas sp. URIL14HWK12:I11]SNZ13794.1 type III secretion protein Q [Pseudomonas sp. URIL14HWK12:I9]